ncbi:hypothetical protein IAQ61_009780 [Plenodomus lingam]|uniref:Pre-mRNA-splicing factor 38B n=1 Tax=Leptosphaeria maculans (strain JN3 / isolate v23.1.3 / race Av1-4-5-6-7-8) TaxID=985895 RepID=E4ZUN3_LEPMJ|nr:hypothetical protein LEMA_P115270.1 [Plenodomus lingam JN3]KAH9863502.1 hypothetical protein IAQ61_009780 [Plenodomus lingam]CBX95112.1 hypothetical protein LEMA_P115270.1 [Plenodomus lingam JN3]
MAGTLDDEYVANLLKQDAKKAAKTYEFVGVNAFNPKRSNSGAPKPNTNFLRHIIRQTDNHNAALLAKEAEEANARLKAMNREKERARRNEVTKLQKKSEGRLTPVSSILSDEEFRSESARRQSGRRDRDKERSTKRGRRDRDSSEEASHRTHRDSTRDARHKRHRDSSGEARQRKRRHDDSDEGRSTGKRRRSRSSHRESSHHKHREGHHISRRRGPSDRHRRPRSYSRSTSRARSRSPRSDKNQRQHRRRNRSHSGDRASKDYRSSRVSNTPNPDHQKSTRQSASPAYDSDPLEAIVGPLPPSHPPAVRSRGRGAHKANSMGIESRFSSTYNPAIDVKPDSDADDDWGDALEVHKDRQRWQQQGADRLRAAGFSEEQVRKWKRGEEQEEEDVVWTRKGQAREWDRGKVVGEDGDVELKADFGRLK